MLDDLERAEDAEFHVRLRGDATTPAQPLLSARSAPAARLGPCGGARMVGARPFVTTRTSIRQDFLDYRIEEPIGQGGMGVVYLAHDVRLGRRVALKVMAPSLARDDRLPRGFARESELAMSLEHPNVVPIHDAGEPKAAVPGDAAGRGHGPARAPTARGALEPARALAIVSQIAQALDAAHAKGLVHRDVKPSNVLLDADEHVYLADFGLTRRLRGRRRRRRRRPARNAGYLAPEQIEGGDVAATDVYSLGCLLYECLTGDPPFPGDSRLAVAWAHLEQEPPAASERRPELPGAVDAVIKGNGEGSGRPVRDLSRACGRGRERADPARSPPAPLGARGGRSLGSGRRGAARRCVRQGRCGCGAPRPPREHDCPDRPSNQRDQRRDRRGSRPDATAVRGGTVWAFNHGDETIVEVDPRTDEVLHTTRLPVVATDLGFGNGPLLAADARGAWMIGTDLDDGQSRLVSIPEAAVAFAPTRTGCS